MPISSNGIFFLFFYILPCFIIWGKITVKTEHTVNNDGLNLNQNRFISMTRYDIENCISIIHCFLQLGNQVLSPRLLVLEILIKHSCHSRNRNREKCNRKVLHKICLCHCFITLISVLSRGAVCLILTMFAMSLTPWNSYAWHNLHGCEVNCLDYCVDPSSSQHWFLIAWWYSH